MVKNIRQKRAIAMVELIFALVIMGIVLMSAPMLIQQSIRSGNVALQQEAIAAVASQTAIVLSMHWDENNSNMPVGASPILDTNRAPFDFNNTESPKGLVGVSSRNSQDGGVTFTPTQIIGVIDTNETNISKWDDIDDYHNSSFGLMLFPDEETTADIGDYIDIDINMSTTVNYTEDREDTGDTILSDSDINLTNKINNTSTGVSNIKFIRVTLVSDSGIKELEKNITLEAFSCNIGTVFINGVDK
jgi:type II secretory pathway pseudopilin PulG